MSMSMLISPFDPDSEFREKSTLWIDPITYKEKLLEAWPKAVFYERTEQSRELFRWALPGVEPLRAAGSSGGLLDNHQTIGFGYGEHVVEFILWHRSVIPPEYPLFLYFLETYYGILPLKIDTTADEIKKFLGLS
ncbi:MAG: hypothetical protein BroJett018_40250 [Chloroflexota bacterium]|nr:MAG: hypothetical protein BroJett018_40250 [Chloroflexota bacterium]